MNKNIRPQMVAQLDQEWAEALEWYRTSKGTRLMHLMDLCAADSPRQLIAEMTADPATADVMQRLAVLALHELAFRLFDRAAAER